MPGAVRDETARGASSPPRVVAIAEAAGAAGMGEGARGEMPLGGMVALEPGVGAPGPGPASPVDMAPSAPTDLTVGDRARPLNVEGKPLFGWLLHDGPNEIQSAYQISVTRKSDQLVIWDSDKVPSSDQAYVTYGGPALDGQTSYSWSVRTWDRGGQVSPWAAPAEFDTGLADSEWAASWIRRASTEVDDYTLARKEVLVTASPVTRARAYVAASHQYELYVDGALVDRGSSFAYPGEGYYQATDITERVRAGEPLAIGAIYHWYGAGQGRPAGERGLLLRLVVEHADGSRQIVVTDGSWRVARGPWQTGAPQRNTDVRDYVERRDARQANDGWDRAGYAASAPAWTAPELIGTHPAGVFTQLVGREARITSTPVAPASLRTLPDGAVVADFGRVMAARPFVHFAAGQSGRSVAMLAGYHLLPDGHVSTLVEDTQGTDLSFGLIQRDGAQDFRAFTHVGWRYLQIAAPGETLEADAIQAIVDHVDAPLERAATFESSNPALNAVFELVQHSALHSAAYQFVDTPTREKGQFLADAINISFATMAGYLERDMTQQALVEFANSQARYWPDGRLNAVYPNGDGARDIPDFTEMYPGWVSRYFLATGDRTLLDRLYPVVVNVANYVWSYLNPATGLITNLAGGSGAYLSGIVDWPMSERYGYDTATAARTTMNVLAVDVMRSAATLGAELGRPVAERAVFTQRAQDLTAAINARLRRPDGIYVDGLSATNEQSPHASQHANAYALAYGVANGEERAAIATYVAGLGMQQGPMTAHWLLKALGDAERVDDVVTRLTDAAGRGWGNVLANGGSFTWESWAPVLNESQSHGWGSQALVDFTETLLGVRVTSPGAATIAVVVPRTNLRSARGVVPTQRGPVRVDFQRAQSDALTLVLEVPVNVRATVSLPVSEGATYSSAAGEGSPALLGVEAGRVRYETGSGRSEFTVP